MTYRIVFGCSCSSSAFLDHFFFIFYLFFPKFSHMESSLPGKSGSPTSLIFPYLRWEAGCFVVLNSHQKGESCTICSYWVILLNSSLVDDSALVMPSSASFLPAPKPFWPLPVCSVDVIQEDEECIHADVLVWIRKALIKWLSHESPLTMICLQCRSVFYIQARFLVEEI